MWFARLVCSEEDCGFEIEVYAEDRHELETLSCDCGYALEIVGFADRFDDEVEVPLPVAA